MARKKAPVLDIPVSYGTVSIGDKTCRVGVTIDRTALEVADADGKMCEKRLSGTITAKPADYDHQHTAFPNMNGDTTLSGVFDVKGISLTKKTLSIGLTFARASVDVETLSHFPKRVGRLVVTAAQDIPEDAQKEEEPDEN